MITVQCPLRVSLFGGGSDYPAFSTRSPGMVVGGTVDKYLYVSINAMPSFARESFRLTYRVTESVDSITQINHPIVRTVLQDLDWAEPINIATMADVPGESGLGSSSAFTVSLRAALGAYRGETLKPEELAKYAIRIERVLLNEPGGIQDQLYPSFGGLRSFRIRGWDFRASEPLMDREMLDEYSENFLLAFTGRTRSTQAPAARTQDESINPTNHVKFAELSSIAERSSYGLSRASEIDEALDITEEGLRRGWDIKSSFHSEVAPRKVREAVEVGLSVGARAGKLLGSGGSGFILFLIEPAYHKRLREAFPPGYVVPFNFTEAALRIHDSSSIRARSRVSNSAWAN